MKLKEDFQIVEMANEYLAIPVGETASTFNGIVALSEETAFILKNMGEHRTKEELVKILIDEYEVEIERANKDIDGILEKLLQIGVIEDNIN